jgi:signal transduction histidine kinase
MSDSELDSGDVFKLRIGKLASKTAELRQTNESLVASNNELNLRTAQLDIRNNAFLESNQDLAATNKELTEANKRFAETNKELAEVNYELTELNREYGLANEHMKAHDRMLTEFINIAAHELRTPTQSILGYTELLEMQFEEEKEKDAQKKNVVAAISTNANRLEKLLKDILDVSKIDGGTLTLHKERLSLNDKIKNVVSDIRTQMKKSSNSGCSKNGSNNDVEIIFESEGAKDIFIEADKVRIYQVISNLIRNAVRFTMKGTVSITTNVNTDKEVIVSIKDTGTGISPDILPRLFSKFVTGSSEGFGLGLYVSKSIVEAHGGSIWAENNNNKKNGTDDQIGGGATFAFSLPNVTN